MESFDDSLNRTMLDEVAIPLKDPVFRRLEKHKFLQAAVRLNEGPRIRKMFAVSHYGDVPDVDTTKSFQNRAQRTKNSSVVTFKSLQDVMDSLKQKNVQQGVKDRISFRDNFDKMGDCMKWLKNKPNRSKLEDMCLKRGIVYEMKDKFFDCGKGKSYKQAYRFMLENADTDDMFVSPETIALHIIDEYLMKNDVDLFAFMNSLKQSEDGLLKISKFAHALQWLDIPLESFEILQGIVALGCDDEDYVDVTAFCERMLDFRKYKWNRILTNKKSLCTDLLTSIEGTKAKNILASPYRFCDAEKKRLQPQAKSAYPDVEIASSLKRFLAKKFQPQIPQYIPANGSQEMMNLPITPTHNYSNTQSVENGEIIRRKKKKVFWPGSLDKILPCYMPGDGSRSDGKCPDIKGHALFHIIRPESSVTKQFTKVPPLTRYKIYGYNGEI